MFDNVLIGIDGKQGGRDAIALARALAAPGARMTLAHVYGIFPGRGATEALPFERAESEHLLERERELAEIDAELAVKGPMTVGQGLHLLAEMREMDLVVVGSTRHAVLGRVLLGDDCRSALDGAPVAVAVAPRGYAEALHGLRRIGIGYDGSPESERALAAARELATRVDGSVTAFRVVSLLDVREEKPIPADWPGEIDALVDRHAEELSRVEGVHGVVTYGGPMEELAQFGKGVDLLIVGSRGYGPIGRVFHGSVSRYLVRHSSCPLIVLPRGAARETGEAAAARPGAEAVVAPDAPEAAIAAGR